MDISDLFWNASMEELKRGFVEENDNYICLLCGKRIEKGIVYQENGTFYEAGRYIRIHIEKNHGSVFEYLVRQDKRITGLTDHQNNLLRLFYEGKSDEEIKRKMDIGSNATIRNHRFVLKEKERQAKVFLAMMELLKEKDKRVSTVIEPHKTATMVDDRYKVTSEESETIIKRYFPKGSNGPLSTFSTKEKNKLVILREIAKRFHKEQTYSEKEVNEILSEVHEDFVTLRRYLIEYGFMDRKPDGSQYWLKNDSDKGESKIMDRRHELKRQYKEMKTEAGIYQIRNIKNQKILVISTTNLKTMNGKLMELRNGGYLNKRLQEEWNKYGEEAFVFEVLEVLEEKEDVFFDKKDELKKLEQKWLERLQPYGDRGYNDLKQTMD